MTTTNPYPVDSATRTCCGGIGGHARDCTAWPPLPPGADPDVEDWQKTAGGRPDYRLVWSTPAPLPERFEGYSLQCVVTQLADGTVCAGGGDKPEVHFGGLCFDLAEARIVAQGLLAAADLADAWTNP